MTYSVWDPVFDNWLLDDDGAIYFGLRIDYWTLVWVRDYYLDFDGVGIA